MLSGAIENNITSIAGNVASEIKFNHEIYSEKFYNVYIEVERLSNMYDQIPIIFSERLIDKDLLVMGTFCEIEGQYRSYNDFKNKGNKLVLNVFARDIIIKNDYKKYANRAFLNGFVCKAPVYRVTPLGREIADILVAVNRPYNKSDYIPCIAWGRNARFVDTLKVGDNLKVWGRIQSRKYQKKQRDGSAEERMAYEISIAKIEKSNTEEVKEKVNVDNEANEK